MDRCALFVDAGYLLADGAMAVHGTRHRETVSWDFGGLLQLLGNLARERTGIPLLRCYWYEATVEGRRAPEHEALADLPGLKLRLGRMRPGRREGVDTEIHRDLMTLARNGALADAVVVSGDEDLAQAVMDAQDLGVRVTVVHVAVDGNWTISRALRQECDDLIEIGSGQLRPFVNLLAGMDSGTATGGTTGVGGSGGTGSGTSTAPLSNGHGSSGTLGSLQPAGSHAGPPPSSPLTGHPLPGSPLAGQSQASTAGSGLTPLSPPPSLGGSVYGSGTASGYEPGSVTGYGSGSSGTTGQSGTAGTTNGTHSTGTHSTGTHSTGTHSTGAHSTGPHNTGPHSTGTTGTGTTGTGGFSVMPDTGLGTGSHPALGFGGGTGTSGSGASHSPSVMPSASPLHAAPTPSPTTTASTHQPTGPQYLPPVPARPPSSPPHGPYTGPQQIAPLPAQQSAPTLADAVKAAHKEGQDFGESVARDAPALWLEAVLARKPRMPSDLEARLLQGSSLPIDFLLHDEVRHALRRGFWDALERSRR
ncbi:NYN domain-containing protein [Actinomadura viridis]|uniref:NYN domain-containing protein n=1 Tax=Actinomadura viridis TaxID=58110 RepID=UPI00369D30B8